MSYNNVQERLNSSTQYKKWFFDPNDLAIQNSARIKQYSNHIFKFYPESAFQVFFDFFFFNRQV